jgi:hypothetical protein
MTLNNLKELTDRLTTEFMKPQHKILISHSINNSTAIKTILP